MPERAGASFALRSPVSLCPCCPEPETLNVTASLPPARIVVTGATGQIGRKALAILARQAWCEHLVGIDLHADDTLFGPELRERLTLVAADLEDPDGAWTRHFEGVDAVLHLAARHSTPDASWEEALGSYNMTLNVLTAAAMARAGWCSHRRTMPWAATGPAAGRAHGSRQAHRADRAGARHALVRWPARCAFAGLRHLQGDGRAPVPRLFGRDRRPPVDVAARIGWILPDGNDPRDITYSGVAHQRAPADGALDEPSRRA